MVSLIHDLRFALRQLKKTPAFTITVLLTLALGIGANAAIFTLANSVLMRNLPVADPATLVRVGDSPNDCCVGWGTRDNGDYSLFSMDVYERMKKNAPEFEELAAIQAGFAWRPITVRRDGADSLARSAMGEYVSGNYFRTFGLRPDKGRLLTDSDDVKGAPMTAVLSYEAWQRDYAGDASAVGSTFWVNTKPVTIVGVAPKGFYGDRLLSTPPEFYLPIETMPEIMSVPYVHDPKTNWIYIVGRVRPGTAMGPLQEKLSGSLRQSFEATGRFTGTRGRELLSRAHVTLIPGGAGIQKMQNDYGDHLHLLMWCAGLVLLVACANIANLLLVRGMTRKVEMSVRAALGAARWRLMRQLLTESLLLATIGGLLGLVVAYAGTQMLLALAFPGEQHVPITASPSAAVVGFAIGLSVVTGVLFGVAPAWLAAKAQPADVLRSGVRMTSSGASKLQRGLVVVQAGLSLVLLVGAGLFSQSLNRLENTDMKLDARNRYVVHINPQAAGYSTRQVEALYRTMEERFHAVPGVVKVGIATYTPMEDNNSGSDWYVQGKSKLGYGASYVKGNAEYFDAVGTRVVMGRGIGVQDTSTAPAVAVVNEAFAKNFFGPENPLGRRIGNSTESSGDYEIVGVVEDTAYMSVRWKDHAMVFIPITQRPPSDKGPIENDLELYAGAIVFETDRPMHDIEMLARKTLAGINPNLTVVKFQRFDQQIADRFSEDRMLARLTTLFGGLALLLAMIGLYGVTAYTVVRRTSEIGIRMALGADRVGVIAMILRGAVVQAGLGLAIGVPVALLCVRFVKTQLYEITKVNAGVLAGAVVTLAVAACVAGLIPARRAASIDPVEALRTE